MFLECGLEKSVLASPSLLPNVVREARGSMNPPLTKGRAEWGEKGRGEGHLPQKFGIVRHFRMIDWTDTMCNKAASDLDGEAEVAAVFLAVK